MHFEKWLLKETSFVTNIVFKWCEVILSLSFLHFSASHKTVNIRQVCMIAWWKVSILTGNKLFTSTIFITSRSQANEAGLFICNVLLTEEFFCVIDLGNGLFPVRNQAIT